MTRSMVGHTDPDVTQWGNKKYMKDKVDKFAEAIDDHMT